MSKVENILVELRNAMYSELNWDGFTITTTSSSDLLPYMFENSGDVPIEDVLNNPEDFDRSLLIVEHLIRNKTT